jgi:hypothetical protein
MMLFMKRIKRGKRQPSFHPVNSLKKEKQEANRVVGRCLFWSDISLSITKNNPFFQSMCDVIAIVGLKYKFPTYKKLQGGGILQSEKNDICTRLEDLKKSSETTGCTVVSNGWTDGKGRTLINFLVHFPRVTVFIKSVDALAHVKDATLLCKLLDGFIQEIGLQHVVQIITDNAANYVVVDKLLMERCSGIHVLPIASI